MGKLVECATITYTLPGETESGDRHLVLSVPDGVLIAVVDGMGHGHEAAVAAKEAINCITRYADSLPLVGLVNRCHEVLSDTRGVVMNLAKINQKQHTLTWLGIGNVAGRLMLKTEASYFAQQDLLLRSGVVGQHLPRLLTSTTRISRGDIVIFATDGISTDFSDNLHVDGPVERIAEHIRQHYCKGNDDALIAVLRYLG